MSATASWARRYWPEIAWAVFAVANLLFLLLAAEWETVPFHFVWVSMTVLYGYRLWGMPMTLVTLALVCVVSSLALGHVVLTGPQGPDELTEVPLMAAMFLVMVWHGRRRQAAVLEARLAATREREFIRDASHELKTPIAVARGLVEVMRSSNGLGRSEQDMADLEGQLERLTAIAEQLVLLQISQQPDHLALEWVDLEDVVVRAVRRWSHTAQRAWRVDVAVDGSLPADPQRLDAALDAVLDNAVRATFEQDTIAVSTRSDGGVALIEVKDSGVGIAPDAMVRIFDRFWSGVPSPDGRRGTGLGLPIVKSIVEAHGGSVQVESTVGRGTLVTLRLAGFAGADPGDGSRAVLTRDG